MSGNSRNDLEPMSDYSQPSGDKPTLSSRILGGTMAVVLGALTIISLPWVLWWKFPLRYTLFGRGAGGDGLLAALHTPPLVMWIAFIAAVTFSAGFKIGAYDMMAVMNVIWKTDESYDPKILEVARSLMFIAVVSGITTFVLLCCA